jgi:exopolyphosphatase / guanosine-5'-triphosphate,3'-diphosphate pyrophosphatase
MRSEKTELRLAEHVERGYLTSRGATALVRAVAQVRAAAAAAGCEELLAFATSALRDADNSAAVLERVDAETGVRLQVLPGEDEARYTFLAVRRWYGWSAGQLLVLDIGGGSLELAPGRDEDPEVAVSLPLGAGRLTRERLSGDPPARAQIDSLAEELDAVVAPQLGRFASWAVRPRGRHVEDVPLAGPVGRGRPVERRVACPPTLTDVELRQVFGFISRIPSADLAELEGVGAGRAHQLVAGASVAAAAMRTLRISELHICPWALREGMILRRLDTLASSSTSRKHWPLSDRPDRVPPTPAPSAAR